VTAARRVPRPVVVLLMGVCGCGKTTVGRRLAGALGWPFRDADDLHPPANVAKMASGRPLDDGDRRPWLAAVRAEIDRLLAAGGGGVVACSALKRAYRAALGAGRPGVRLVHLTGEPELLAGRLRRRRGHFMPPELLASQLATLEPPARALVIDIAPPAAELARRIAADLGLAARIGA
jgi:gluconokinase